MFKKTVNYTNFNDERKSQDLYFHLSKPELLELISGGTQERMNEALAKKDTLKIIKEIKTLVDSAIGVRTEDGEGFDKSAETVEKLKKSAAYDELISDLLIDENSASEFIMNLAPKELREQLAKDLKLELNKTPNPLAEPTTINHGSAMQKHVLDGPAWIRENREPTKQEMRTITKDQMRVLFAMRASKKVVAYQPAWLREKRMPTNEEYMGMSDEDATQLMQAMQDGLLSD